MEESWQASTPLCVFFLALIINSHGVFSARFSNIPLGRPSSGHNSASSSPISASEAGEPARDYERGDVERVEFFEVAKPVDIPHGTHEACSQILVQHVFGNTINDPPTLSQYTPPRNCTADAWSLVVLRFTATSKGRQYDRISAVWLGGVEIFRTCTAEPSQRGIVWTVEKDVTRFSSLFRKPRTLAIMLANVVNTNYTGLFNVTLSAHFYAGGEESQSESAQESYGGVAADVVLPIAETSSVNGHWFRVYNETDAHAQAIRIPRNAYKAVLEVCVSPHAEDEFWYTNPPNDFLAANNLTGQVSGNGTFREILVSIDGLLAAVVNPFVVLYTGGISPSLWRPISAIGSFALPSYDVEVTPFLATLVDGKRHNFSLTVTNALQYWLISANLHLWVDPSLESTSGALVYHSASALMSQTKSTFRGFNGTFLNEASRSVSFAGYQKSSFGNLTTTASFNSRFTNTLVFAEDGYALEIHQESKMESKLLVKSEFRGLVFHHRAFSFPLKLSYRQTDYVDNSSLVEADIAHSWVEGFASQSGIGEGRGSFGQLKNNQRSQGETLIVPEKGVFAVATTKQFYAYEGSDGCYWRSVAASNYTFLYDDSDARCTGLLLRSPGDVTIL